MSDLGFGNVNTTLSGNNGGDDEKQKTKKYLIMIFATMVILAIVVVVLLVLISKGEKPKLSLNIDGKVIKSGIYYEYDKEAGSWFFSVKDLAETLTYTYNRGGIEITDESEANCTIVNPNKLEKVIFESNKQELVKYYTYSDAIVDNQHFDIKNSIRFDATNKRIMADQSAIERAFNCLVSYNETTLKLTIQTLEGSIIRSFNEAEKTAANNTREYASDAIRFQNNKALLRGLIIVKDPVTGLYGINKYNETTKGFNPVVSTKYKSFKFIEGLNKFIAQGENSKYGILAETGEVDVDLAYTYLDCIDIKNGLYVAGADNGKKCVVSGANAQTGYKSKIIIPADYDKIGLTGNGFKDDKMESDYILCKSLIPVQQNGKWGFYSLDGTKVIDPIYDGVGCSAPQGQVTGGRANIRGCVVIPEISAIVVQEKKEIQDSRGNKRVTPFYGLINYKGELKVTTKATAIFSSTENNIRTYYYGNDQEQINVVSYWRENNLGDSIYSTTRDTGLVNSSTNEVTTVDQNQTVVENTATQANEIVNSTNETTGTQGDTQQTLQTQQETLRNLVDQQVDTTQQTQTQQTNPVPLLQN